MIPSKLEVLVDLGPQPDQAVVDKTLDALRAQDQVKEAIFKDGAILLETTLPSSEVLDMVTKISGRRAVLQGFGERKSAVCMVSGECCGARAVGVVRFQQAKGGALLADGTIDGLAPGPHGLHVHVSGDLSQGCASLGGHFNPSDTLHGAPQEPASRRHAGDLGNIVADNNGRAAFRILDEVLKLDDIIGRSLAVTEREDDLGRGTSPTSKVDGNSGKPIACGIIARSAGVFQNPKRVCLCDGVVVWDEKDRPLAGKGRRSCYGKDKEHGKGDVEDSKKHCYGFRILKKRFRLKPSYKEEYKMCRRLAELLYDEKKVSLTKKIKLFFNMYRNDTKKFKICRKMYRYRTFVKDVFQFLVYLLLGFTIMGCYFVYKHYY